MPPNCISRYCLKDPRVPARRSWPYRREEAWATLVSFLGLPADPAWADHILRIVEGKKRIEEIDGIGCEPALISATTD